MIQHWIPFCYKTKTWIIVLSWIMLSTILIACSKSKTNMPQPALTEIQKVFACRAGIATAYGRNIDIIKKYQIDSDENIFVEYARADGDIFRYACKVQTDIIVYSMFDKNEGEWGRWRYDEKIEYIFSNTHLTIRDAYSGEEKRFAYQDDQQANEALQ